MTTVEEARAGGDVTATLEAAKDAPGDEKTGRHPFPGIGFVKRKFCLMMSAPGGDQRFSDERA